MTWLHEHGLISSWRDYEDMPLRTWADARMLMQREAEAQKKPPPLPRRR